MKYTVNGEERTAREFRIGRKFRIAIYHKCKHRDKLIDINRDRFFGTGVTVLLFLKF